jgi:aldehyde:ferredoxin oxidoreductase
VRAYALRQTFRWIVNHIGLCVFLPWSRTQTIEMVSAVTGWETNVWELRKTAERALTLARLFNLREGLSRADDVLPPRMSQPHFTKTFSEKPILPETLDAAVTMYYGMMGWDPQTGMPGKAKLDELDIAWARAA